MAKSMKLSQILDIWSYFLSYPWNFRPNSPFHSVDQDLEVHSLVPPMDMTFWWHAKFELASRGCFLSDCFKTLHLPPMAWWPSGHFKIFQFGIDQILMTSSEIPQNSTNMAIFGLDNLCAHSQKLLGISTAPNKLSIVGKPIHLSMAFGYSKIDLMFSIAVRLAQSQKKRKFKISDLTTSQKEVCFSILLWS